VKTFAVNGYKPRGIDEIRPCMIIKPTRRRQRPRQRASTLREVAERAGVSTASASRALARPSLVSAAVQEKVLGAASALSYVPNASARALSASRAELAGVVLARVATPVTLRALQAFDSDLSAAGIGLLLTISGEGRSSADCAHWLERRGAAAIALFGTTGAVDRVEAHRPWVTLDLGFGRAVELAARYLYELGHRRLSLVGESGFGRSEQFLSALSDRDERRIDFYHAQSVDSIAVGRQVVERLLLRDDPPSALVCSSDVVAASVQRACLDHGISVPGAVSLVAIGDSGLAGLTRPSLTCVRIAAEEAGAAAASTILALLEGRSYEEARPTVKLVLRGSCAAPR
jgi:LacI family transcriptional regulator